MDDTSVQSPELEKVRRHVRILVDLGRAAGETADLNRFLDQTVVQVARAVEIGHVKVLRYRRREADLLVAAGFGWKEGVVGSATLPADLRSPPGRSFQTAEPVCIWNFDEQQDFILSDLLRQHHIVSLVNVPVLTAGAAWGVLEIFWYHPLLAIWRTSGTIRLALGRRPGWGEIPREALEEAPAGALTPLTR